MFEKLVDVEKRYDELSDQLQDPAVVTNQENYRNIMKEYKQLTPLIEKFREYINSIDRWEVSLDRSLWEIINEEIISAEIIRVRQSSYLCWIQIF